MNDTTPVAHKKQMEIIMSKTSEERFMMGIEMMNDVRKKAAASAQSLYFLEKNIKY